MSEPTCFGNYIDCHQCQHGPREDIEECRTCPCFKCSKQIRDRCIEVWRIEEEGNPNNPNCQYYGKNLHGMDTEGNQCGMKEGHAPCEMEMRGEEVNQKLCRWLDLVKIMFKHP